MAQRYPGAREALTFYGEIASFQQGVSADSPLSSRQALLELVLAKGPPRLRDAAQKFDEAACQEALEAYLTEEDTTSPRSFFARVLLLPQAATAGMGGPPRRPNRCPCCGHSPQVGCLRPQGDGTALSLICSLCLNEWPFQRAHCPACGERDEKKIAYYSTPELEHLQVQVCESCHRYFHSVNLSKDPKAIPDVDEVAALPLDVWAHEKGLEKLHLNLVGI